MIIWNGLMRKLYKLIFYMWVVHTKINNIHNDGWVGYYIIQNWMRTTNNLLFLGTWEYFYNEKFNSIEFDRFKNESGTNTFVMTLKKWIKSTNAIRIISKQGRYTSGTYGK